MRTLGKLFRLAGKPRIKDRAQYRKKDPDKQNDQNIFVGIRPVDPAGSFTQQIDRVRERQERIDPLEKFSRELDREIPAASRNRKHQNDHR